jgi:hypothetical protein
MEALTWKGLLCPLHKTGLVCSLSSSAFLDSELEFSFGHWEKRKYQTLKTLV